MPLTAHAQGVRLAIRLTPKAAKNYFGQVVTTADGSAWLKAYVTTIPEAGKANKALIKMLAKSLKLPARDISVASGATNRNKQLLIAGNSQDLTRRLDQWIKELAP
ncbi:MAG: DUF167 domain-containing protein [Alphaproteobacteria bacterium]|nr:DUF167 domain-containing protein [Alphaproteobacteria bacterium]